MTTVANNMSSTFSLQPCFISSSKVSESKAQSKNNDDFIFNDLDLDFDLLADYLSEEADTAGFSEPPTTFDLPDVLSVADHLPKDNPTPTLVPTPSVVQHHQPAYGSDGALPQAVMPPSQPILQNIAPVPTQNVSQNVLVNQNKRQRVEPPKNVPNTMHVISQPYQVSATSVNQLQYLNRVNDQKSGSKSQAQIDRRRERNRILARRTRLRKKFFFESLQKEVMDLQKENFALKQIVESKIGGENAESILNDCKANQQLPDVVLEHCGDPSLLGKQDFNLITSIKQSQESFVITDPSLQDNPVVYASDGFLELTGYSREQVLGRNCRFLQGEDTDQKKVAEIRQGLQKGDDVSVTFLNYCADGTPFWNKLFIAALRDAHNNIVNYIGVSVKVAGDHGSNDIQGTGASYKGNHENNYFDENGNNGVDFDATILALEGAVTKAVAAAPKMVKNMYNEAP